MSCILIKVNIIGANALKILQEIGVYDEVAKYMPDPTKLNMPGIHHVSSQDGHELIHNVSLRKYVR